MNKFATIPLMIVAWLSPLSASNKWDPPADSLYNWESRVISDDGQTHVYVNDVYVVYKYTVKQRDTAWHLSRAFCATHVPAKLRVGERITIRVSLHQIKNTYVNFINHNANKSVDEYTKNDIARYLYDKVLISGLPPCLVLAIIYVESVYNPYAQSHTNDYGLMQISQGNMAKHNVTRKDLLIDYHLNINIGLGLLRERMEKYNRWDWWVTYNTGSRFKLVVDGVDLADAYRKKVLKVLDKIYDTIDKQPSKRSK